MNFGCMNFGRFPCMLCATAVDHVTIATGVGMGMGMLDYAMCSHAYMHVTCEHIK